MLLILWTCISEHKVHNPTYSADTVARAAGGWSTKQEKMENMKDEGTLLV